MQQIQNIIEFGAERQSWTSNNDIGAYDSPLKWPLGGGRSYTDVTLHIKEKEKQHHYYKIRTFEVGIKLTKYVDKNQT